MLRWCLYTLPDFFKYSRETWLQLCVGWFQHQAQHTIATSPSVTPVIFIVTATVQEKKKEKNQQTCHTVYMVETRTHQHTTLQTCPLKFALFQLARSRFPDPRSTESGTSASGLKNYRAEVTVTEALRNCRARCSSQIKTIWGCNSTKRSQNNNTLSGRRGVRTEVEHCVSRAWDELDHTHIVR